MDYSQPLNDLHLPGNPVPQKKKSWTRGHYREHTQLYNLIYIYMYIIYTYVCVCLYLYVYICMSISLYIYTYYIMVPIRALGERAQGKIVAFSDI